MVVDQKLLMLARHIRFIRPVELESPKSEQKPAFILHPHPERQSQPLPSDQSYRHPGILRERGSQSPCCDSPIKGKNYRRRSLSLFSRNRFNKTFEEFEIQQLLPISSSSSYSSSSRFVWTCRSRLRRPSTCWTMTPSPATASRPTSGWSSSSRPTPPGRSPPPSSPPIAPSPSPPTSSSSSSLLRSSSARSRPLPPLPTPHSSAAY